MDLVKEKRSKMQTNQLIARNVSKIISNKTILNDISLDLSGGKVYGLVGENGSGKTMLFRVLCGLVKPTFGTVLLNNNNIHKKIGNLNIGVIIENSLLWPDMSGWENLYFLSTLTHRIRRDEIDAVLERVGLDPSNQLPIRKYSLGMKQRLLVAQAVMEKPDFLFLDEPTNTIDKEGSELIRKIVLEEADRGAVVLMASHISQDISSLCDGVYYMKDGCIHENEVRR